MERSWVPIPISKSQSTFFKHTADCITTLIFCKTSIYLFIYFYIYLFIYLFIYS